MIRQRPLVCCIQGQIPLEGLMTRTQLPSLKMSDALPGCEGKRAEAARVTKPEPPLVSTLLRLTLRFAEGKLVNKLTQS